MHALVNIIFSHKMNLRVGSLSSTDVHTVASLLKLYLRELPEPLVPYSRYEEFLACGKKIPLDREQVSLVILISVLQTLL